MGEGPQYILPVENQMDDNNRALPSSQRILA